MMYPYMTFPDETEITYSEIKENGKVKIYIETPDEKDGFHDAICWLPDCEWTNHGYSEEEMSQYKALIQEHKGHIMELAGEEDYIEYEIDTVWDEEAKVYTATCKDIPGFVIEAESYEALLKRIDLIVKDLFDLNHIQQDKRATYKINDSVEVCKEEQA